MKEKVQLCFVKERIIQAALSLFWRYGIKSITMDDIAHDQGISKRTIYQHFPDKEAILEHAISHELATQKCEIQKVEEATSNPIDEMLQTSEQMQSYMANMNPVLMYDLKKYYPKAWQMFASYKNDFVLNSLKDNLHRGIERGYYHKDLNVDILAVLRMEQIELAFDPTIFPPKNHSMVDIQVQFVHHYLRGLLTEKGYNYYNSKQFKLPIETNTHEK